MDEPDRGPGGVEHRHIAVSKRLVAINSGSQVVARILNLTVLLWAYQYLLRRIPAEDFAVLPVISAVMVFAPLFFSLFTGGIARYVVEAYARDDPDEVARVVSSIFAPLAIASVAFLLLAGLFAAHVEQVLTIAPSMVGDARIMVVLLAASFALQMLAMPFSVGFHARQKFVEMNLFGVGRDLLKIALLIFLLVGFGAEVLWVAVATFVSEVAYTAVMFFRSRAMAPELRFARRFASFAKARTLLSFGLWTSLGRMGTVLYTHSGALILNALGTPVDVASYHIAATLFRQIDSIVQFAAAPLQPAVTAMHALNDNVRLSSAMLRGGRYALWASLAMATPLAVFAGPFVELYAGPTYSVAALALVILLVNFLATAPTVLLAMVAVASERMREFFLPAFITQALGFTLMLVAAGPLDGGVVGAAVALALVTVGGQIAVFWPLHLRWGGFGFAEYSRRTLAPGMAPAIAGGLAWSLAASVLDISSWVELILAGIPGGAIYLAAVYVALDPRERGELHGLLRQMKVRVQSGR